MDIYVVLENYVGDDWDVYGVYSSLLMAKDVAEGDWTGHGPDGDWVNGKYRISRHMLDQIIRRSV